ncbi:FHA domain-containing protein, partial [Planctomycetota bacterium]
EDVKVEDLGSKNGTFINGQRLEESLSLVKGDKVRLADVEIIFAWPGAAAPEPVPEAEPKEAGVPSEARPRKSLGGYGPMIKKCVAAIIIIITAAIVYSYISGYESGELIAARELVDETEAWLDDIRASDEMQANREALDELGKRKGRLGEILPEYADPYARAGELIGDIDKLRESISAVNKTLTFNVEAQAAYDAIMNSSIVIDTEDALGKLQRLMLISGHPGGRKSGR